MDSTDEAFVSGPDLYTCLVVRSVLKTKHSAVVLTCSCRMLVTFTHLVQKGTLSCINPTDRLRYCLGVYPWRHLLQFNDVEYLYTQLVSAELRRRLFDVGCNLR